MSRLGRSIALTLAVSAGSVGPADAAWTQLSGPHPPAAAAFGTHGSLAFLGTNDADAGDVFRSTDDGHTWSNVGIPNGGVTEFLSVGNALLFGSYLAGVYRSTDDGDTWARADAGFAPFATPAALAAVDGQTALAGTDDFSLGALYRSTDTGATWAPIDGAPAIRCRDLLVLGTTVLAGGEAIGVLRSTDAGVTWAESNAGLPATRHVDRFVQHGASIFAAMRTPFAVAVSHSEDGGVTWSAAITSGLPSASQVTAFFESAGALWLGTLTTAGESGLYRSTDDGATWQRRTGSLPVPDRVLGAGTLGGDIVVGTVDGAFRSADAGATWAASWLGAAGISGSRAVLGSGPVLLTGLHHFGTIGLGIRRTTDLGTTWTPATGIAASTTALDFLEFGDTILAAAYGVDRGVVRSTDGGQSFAPSSVGLPTNLTMKSLHAHEGTVFASSWTDLYRSSDSGVSWTVVPAMANVERLVSLGGDLFAGRYGTGVVHSTDGGVTWIAANDGLPQGASTYVNDLEIFDGTIYAATAVTSGVWRWNGAAWENAGLPGAYVNELLAVDGALLAGTALDGLHVTTDGVNWTGFVDGYAGGEVWALGVVEDRVVAGTRSHGLWSVPRGDLPAATSVPAGAAVASLTVAPSPFRAITRLAFSLERPSSIRVTIHDVQGRLVRELLSGVRPTGRLETTWSGDDSRGRSVPAGVYFARLEIGGTPVSTRRLIKLR
ncbi:MAG: hypothetical protein KC591_10735 [Gemmatimonadetes bacterium]|nr:hypothetical protein [Gemmatimonadota bacterium]